MGFCVKGVSFSLEGFFVVIVVCSLLSPDLHGILHLSEIKRQNETRWWKKPNYVVLISLMSMTLTEGSGATHPSLVKKGPNMRDSALMYYLQHSSQLRHLSRLPDHK